MRLIKAVLDLFNSGDGTGNFTGVTRYASLGERMVLAAKPSRTVREFWDRLLAEMRWPIPPRYRDAELLALIERQDTDADTLRALATNAASVVMIARALHAEGRAELRRLRAAEGLEDDATPEGGPLF